MVNPTLTVLNKHQQKTDVPSQAVPGVRWEGTVLNSTVSVVSSVSPLKSAVPLATGLFYLFLKETGLELLMKTKR